MDFSAVTACGEDCTGCKKKADGLCPGCIEADGFVPEWAESGRCKIHACAKKHGARFCGVCPEFPCQDLPQFIHWEPSIAEKMAGLRNRYLADLAAPTGL